MVNLYRDKQTLTNLRCGSLGQQSLTQHCLDRPLENNTDNGLHVYCENNENMLHTSNGGYIRSYTPSPCIVVIDAAKSDMLKMSREEIVRGIESLLELVRLRDTPIKMA